MENGNVNNGADAENENENKDVEKAAKSTDRLQWANQFEYFLSYLGGAVGLANVWRFPYLCYRNGGGAFLIPYFLMSVMIGAPLIFLQMSLGQFTSNGPTTCWEYAPIFKGFGLGRAVVGLYVAVNYNVIVAWSLYYLCISCTSVLPWIHCNNWWNTPKCSQNPLLYNVTRNESLPDMNITEGRRLVLPSEEYYSHGFLQISSGIATLGEPLWYIVVALLAAWSLTFCGLIKSVKSIGKVQYVTALFPYVILTTLLVRGALLPNSMDGIKFYLIPEWERLSDVKVWYDAAVQILYSYAVCTGQITTMASYNPFTINSQIHAIRLAAVNCATSMFAGFVVFSYLGYLAAAYDVPITEVANSGAGLAFIVYPSAVTLLPLSPLWSFLFFLMLVVLGLGSDFSINQNLTTSISDLWPDFFRGRHIHLLSGTCISGFICGLILTTRGGVYVVQLLDTYATSTTTFLVAFIEVVSIAWVYGYSRFIKEIECMSGYRPIWYWRYAWSFITPVTLAAVIVFSWVNFSMARYGDYVYPAWANAVGWCISMSSLIVVPIYTGYRLLGEQGTVIERIKALSRPSESWGPAKQEDRVALDELMAAKASAKNATETINGTTPMEPLNGETPIEGAHEASTPNGCPKAVSSTSIDASQEEQV